MTRQILSLILAASLAVPTQSAVYSPKPYLSHCEGLLSAISEGEVEPHLLGQIQTPDQLLRLLIDYGVVGQAVNFKAMMLALVDHGFEILKPDNGSKVQQGVNVERIEALVTAPEATLNKIAWTVMDHTVTLAAGKNEPTSEIQVLQLRRLDKALKKWDRRKMFESLITSLILSSAYLTINEINKRIEENERRFTSKKADRLSLVTAGTTTGAFAALYISYLNLPRFSAYVQNLIGIEEPANLGPAVAFAGAFGIGLSMIVGAYSQKIFLKRDFEALKKRAKDMVARSNAVDHYSFFDEDLSKFLNSVYTTKEGSRFNLHPSEVGINSWLEVKDGPLLFARVWTLADACKRDICAITPVDIAYLGHLDFLAFQVQAQNLTRLLGNADINMILDKVTEAANDLRTNPSSFALQMKTRDALNSAITEIQKIEDLRNTETQKFKNSVASLSAAAKMLKELPYTDKNKMTQTRILHYELLTAKMDAELKRFIELDARMEPLFKPVGSLNPLIQQLQELSDSLPKSSAGWDAAANNVILTIESLSVGI